MDKLIKAFLKGKPYKLGTLYTDGLGIYSKNHVTEDFSGNGNKLKNLMGKVKIISGLNDGQIIENNRWYHVKYNTMVISTIALTTRSGVKLGNSAILPFVNRKAHYGIVNDNRSITPIQLELEKSGVAMLPFNALHAAGVSYNDVEIVASGSPESISVDVRKYCTKENGYITKTEKRHFTGWKILKSGDKCFLFDVDRREVEHKIFNAFMVQLPRLVNTIEEAYDSLMPSLVKSAKSFERQGEWFFIKANEDIDSLIKDKGLHAIPFSLQVGRNRPNRVDLGVTINNITYVKGTVSHTGREHAELKLNDWHIAMPNAATNSFTITGDVD